FYASWSAPLHITLAADDPLTTIYYTTDGSTPTLTSAHALTPIIGLPISVTTTVTYFGINLAAQGVTTADVYDVDTSTQAVSRYMVTDTTLDGTSPVVVANPGQVLSASANWRIWVQG